MSVKRQVKYILSTKTELAEKKVNEFLETLNVVHKNDIKITPLLSYNGPSILIGAMIEYWKEVEDESES